MNELINRTLRLLLFLLILAPVPAAGQDIHFNYVPKQFNDKRTKHDAGQTTGIESIFNPTTQRFLWKITFVPSPVTGRLPDGLNLVVNTGFSPKSRQGEMAIFFFDGLNPADPKLTVYGYNGADTDSSWQVGSHLKTGPPDKILTSLFDKSWIFQLKVENSPGKRVFIIDISTAIINAHVPLYLSQGPWIGVRFAQGVGIWSHPISGSSATYGQDGFLTSKGSGTSGFVDDEFTLTQGCDGVPGSNEQLDPCGICGGDGTSCAPPRENCELTNIVALNFSLDAGANSMKSIVTRGVNALRRGRVGAPTLFTKNALVMSESLFTATWINAWQIPQVITSCTASASCLQVSTAPGIQQFSENFEKLAELADRIIRRVSQRLGKDARITAILNRRYSAAQREVKKALGGVPRSNFVCP